ncbi:MAG: beta-ketoacyl synthase, partial [Deltaproteobacteria bacterium]
QTPGDAAVLMVLKRHADAVRDGDEILAVMTTERVDDAPGLTLSLDATAPGLTPVFGHAHAASGLLHVAGAVTACASRALPSRVGPMPWLPASRERHARVHVTAGEGQSTTTDVRTASVSHAAPVLLGPAPRLGVFSADSMDGLVRALVQRDGTGQGAFRVAIVGETGAEYEQRVDRAVTLLRAHRDTSTVTIDDGIHFGTGPMAGELSFVFTGAAGAYAHMGRDLALAFPDLVDRFAARAGSLRDAASWVYSDDPDLQTTPSEKLWGASYLSQLHAEFTRGMLGLEPTAAIGYCSGETNSLFALDAWSDLDGFRRDVDASRVYDRELCGELLCVGRAWSLPAETPPSWATWRVRAPVDQVRAAAAGEPRAHLVIINSPTDVVIAGDPEGCARIAAVFGRKAVRTTGYDFVMHCPEASEFRSQWRALHHRPTSPVPGVRFYTHATRSSYAPDIESVADALTGQAMNTVDFPGLVERAYADGVRVFIEHGPHAGCTKWIGDVLGAREHLAVALDRYGHSSLFQALEGVARLAAAGVPVDHRAVT